MENILVHCLVLNILINVQGKENSMHAVVTGLNIPPCKYTYSTIIKRPPLHASFHALISPQ